MYGHVVRAARVSRGLTQDELAEISGVDQPNISAIENDRRQPSAATLHQLLLACGYRVVAEAGDRIIRFPAAPDDIAFAHVEREPDLSDADRLRVMTAVLEAAEATVRSRSARPR